jgi:transcriptional regulator with XRE-family HTH domain
VNQLLERLNKDFQNEDNRYVYADTVTNAFVSAQIKALKEDRKLSQEELAELIGTQQSGISRLLRSDYSAWKVETLRKLARAFGVRLRITFEEFGTLADDVSGFTKDRLLPKKFTDDPAFKAVKRNRAELGAAKMAEPTSNVMSISDPLERRFECHAADTQFDVGQQVERAAHDNPLPPKILVGAAGGTDRGQRVPA